MSDLPGVPDDVIVVVDSPALPAVERTLSVDQSKLIQLITDIVTKKPGTKAEALAVFHTLQIQLGTWLVSELPALEAKATLVALWAVQEVGTLASSCFAWK